MFFMSKNIKEQPHVYTGSDGVFSVSDKTNVVFWVASPKLFF